jgi:hypothetical protein
MSEVKILLLSDDGELQASLLHLTEVGRATYGAAVRREPEFARLKDEHRNALESFASAARSALRGV